MIWTTEKTDALRLYYPMNSNKELARAFKCSLSAIKNKAIKLGLRKSDQYQNPGNFKKGNRPWNANTKGLTSSNPTSFKAGNIPHNTKHDGAISIRSDKRGVQYKFIRVAKGKWQMLHVHVWENEFGKVPDGHLVIFKDGNTMNTSIENLQCISRKENLLRNLNRKKAAITMKKTWERAKRWESMGLEHPSIQLRSHQHRPIMKQ